VEYHKNGSRWTLISAVNGKRISVSSNGSPWVLNDTSIRLYNDNGNYTTTNRPVYSSTWDRFVDIGSADDEIYVSMKHLRNGRKQLLKYSNIANQLIRQPGAANFLDGQGNGVIFTN